MERLSMMGMGSRAIVGEPTPRFTAKAIIDGRIKDIAMHSYTKSQQWVILVFFPMAWSSICPTEIVAFAARVAEFESRGAAVLFCSTDSEHALRAWNAVDREEGGLGSISGVPLVSDRSHRICRDYGVLVEEEGVAQRALFIVDPRGIVRFHAVNDANIGRSVDETRRLLDALRFSDEFGEGCPVDWKLGSPGLTLHHHGHDDASLRPQSPGLAHPKVSGAANSQRPGVIRGLSWSGWSRGVPASQTKSKSGNPDTDNHQQQSPAPSRPRSLLWQNTNDEAVAQNETSVMALMLNGPDHSPGRSAVSGTPANSPGGGLFDISRSNGYFAFQRSLRLLKEDGRV